MKKIIWTLVLIFGILSFSICQNTADDLQNESRDFLYVNAKVANKSIVNNLSRSFSVDGCFYDSTAMCYRVRIFLARHEYCNFLAQQLPFEIIPAEPARAGMVATTLSEMAAWDKYPSYDVYVQMMQNFQSNYPNICKLDTILAATPNPTRPHAILAVHLGNTIGQKTDKPAFLYSSTMHGDEVVGYYMMLRLIDYIVTHATTDPQVQQILQNVDLYICPLENPDGTFNRSNTQISSYASSRYNYNNVDLNRNYPFLPGVSGNASVQPETQAMINWISDKHFVVSANFHGGAELANYPWDSWESATKSHSDAAWYQYVCQNYVNDCQAVDPTYMVGETAYQPGCGSVTEGGDWYEIDGSRQDYMNYYQHCREITLEVHFDKVVTSSSELPTYWTNSKSALLNYIMESLNGFRGIVTDAVTGEPIEAKIFVNNHDSFNSEVYSHLPIGNYHRPIKAGTYSVTVSADCYQPHTFTISPTDGAIIRHNVQLYPLVAEPQVADQYIIEGETATFNVTSNHTLRWYDSANATTPIFTGNSFTTPMLTNTTTYFIEEFATDNTLACVSTRDSATVFVTPAIHDTVYGNLTIATCDSYEIDNQIITQSGTYTFSYPYLGQNHADSILTLQLTIYPSYAIDVPHSCTVGDMYYVEGVSYYALEPGTYYYERVHQTIHGCDSIINYTINVLSGNMIMEEVTREECSPFVYEGEVLISNGDYPFFYPGTAVGGLDSILIIHLTIYPSYELIVDTTAIIGEHLLLDDYDFYALQDGFYLIDNELTTIHGCDSLVHYRISVGATPVNSAKKLQMSVYPNPTDGVCFITSSPELVGAEICIFNHFGQKIQQIAFAESEQRISLEHFPSGIYTIQITQNQVLLTSKIIKL